MFLYVCVGQPENEPEQTPALAARMAKHPGIADFMDVEVQLRQSDGDRRALQKARNMTLNEFRLSIRENLKQKQNI